MLEAESASARELETRGEIGVRFVDVEQATDGAPREVSVDAEIVLVAEPPESGGCGVAPGRPSSETLRCG